MAVGPGAKTLPWRDSRDRGPGNLRLPDAVLPDTDQELIQKKYAYISVSVFRGLDDWT